MIGPGTVCAFLGLPGLSEILVVAVVTLVLYGRSGLLMHRRVQALRPLLGTSRRVSSRTPSPRRAPAWGDRVFWILAITAAAAVAAWVVTRMTVVTPASSIR